jgi:predicted N-formylglutamate amidohydrolase
MQNKKAYLLSCVHGGNQVPKQFKHLFKTPGQKIFLQSHHNSFDKGALVLAKNISRKLKLPLFSNTNTKLLIDLDCSLHNTAYLFKPDGSDQISKNFTSAEKEKIIKEIYLPYYRKVEKEIAKQIKAGKTVFHLVVHTFTPVLKGKVRQADIGLLFNPRRKKEAEFCNKWRKVLNGFDKNIKIRFNYPYSGTEDGLTTSLRKKFGEKYIGLEIEVNQKFPLKKKKEWIRIQEIIVESLKILLNTQNTINK